MTTIALIGNWEPEMNITVPGEAEYREWQTIDDRGADKAPALDVDQNTPDLRFINGVDVADIEEGMLTLKQVTGRLYEQVMTGLIKPVTRWLPNDDAVQAVENLKREMPHLGEFWDEVLIAMNLVIRLNATRFTLPPMILNGSPGVGKTFALFSLAEALDLSMESIPMSTTGAGFILSGSERGWRDPVPGLLAKSAAKSRHINPIFILDEFEKARFRRDAGMNGLEPEVLQMLERDSAKRFRDVFLEQDLDLSEISYIGSSNSTSQIPEPILSRVKIIEIGYPSVDSLQQIYTSILNKALQEDFGIEGLRVMVCSDIKQLAQSGLSPRLVRNNAGKILANALYLAKSGECVRISGADLVNLIKSTTNSQPRGIGFLATI